MFTPTEGGAFAAIYAIIVCMGYYRELSFRDLLRVSARAARTTAVVMLIVATATAVGWFITIAQIPNQVTDLFRPLIDSPVLLLLAINIFLLLVGMVMDLTPNILIFAPVFYPLITQAGIDPYFFGLLFILNLGIGVITPPVGTVLYVVCGVGNIKITKLVPGHAAVPGDGDHHALPAPLLPLALPYAAQLAYGRLGSIRIFVMQGPFGGPFFMPRNQKRAAAAMPEVGACIPG